jgi:hypothetical protein
MACQRSPGDSSQDEPRRTENHASHPVTRIKRRIPLTRLDANFDSKHDTMHSLAAEQHTHAAYEHWAAHYRQKRGEETLARKFGRTALKHSMKAAELSKEALRQEPGVQKQGVQEVLTVAAD